MAALLVIMPAALSSKPLRTRPLARSQPPAPLGWFLFGTSATYLAHFASLYPQLPGLFGDAGLQPVRFTIGVSDMCDRSDTSQITDMSQIRHGRLRALARRPRRGGRRRA